MGLTGEDVQPGSDPARDELGHQCRLVDDLAARRVDEAGAVTQERQPPVVDQPLGLGLSGTWIVTMSDSVSSVSRSRNSARSVATRLRPA